MQIDMEQFVRERDEALLSLDKRKIRKYMKKYGVRFQLSNELVFWASIHKAILGINGSTPEQKRRSADWLVANGFKPEF